MELLNDCPECGKQLSKSRKYCACGWKIPTVKTTISIDRNCPYPTEKGPCNKQGSICPGNRGTTWFCSDHWYKAICESYKY
jgi:hypothetical protein